MVRAPACPYCGVRNLSDQLYKEHLLTSHSEEFFHCAECNTYIDRKSLVIHMSLHAIHYATTNNSAIVGDDPAVDSVNKKTDNIDHSMAIDQRIVDETQKTDVHKDLPNSTTRINVVINAQSTILVDNIVNENQSKKADMQQNLLVIKRVVPVQSRPSVERLMIEESPEVVTATTSPTLDVTKLSAEELSQSGENITQTKDLNRNTAPIESRRHTELVIPEPKHFDIILPQPRRNCLYIREELRPENKQIAMEPPPLPERILPKSKDETVSSQNCLKIKETPDVELCVDFDRVVDKPKLQESKPSETEQSGVIIDQTAANPTPSEVERVVAELLCPEVDVQTKQHLRQDIFPNNENAVLHPEHGQDVIESSEVNPVATEQAPAEVEKKENHREIVNDVFVHDTQDLAEPADGKRDVTEPLEVKRVVEECLGVVTEPTQQAVRWIEPAHFFPFVTELPRHESELAESEPRRQDVARIVEQVVAERNRIADFGSIFSEQKRYDIEHDEFSDHSDVDSFDLPESIFDAIDDSQDARPDVEKRERPPTVGASDRKPVESDGKKKKNQISRKCPICQKEYRASSSYFYHMKYVHRGEKEHACSVCGKRVATRAALAQHEAVHSRRFDLECGECGKKFRSKVSLYIHTQNHKAPKNFLCDSCPLSFKWKQQLLRHLKRHAEEKCYACPMCGKAFKVRYDMIRHAKTHSAGAHACGRCGTCFAQLRYLKVHMVKKHGVHEGGI